MPNCVHCKGRGSVIINHFQVDCPECQGTGKTGEPGACARCNNSLLVVVNGFQVDCPECSALAVVELEASEDD